MKDIENNDVPKTKAKYDEADFKMLGKNAKAKCILVYGLGPDEFNYISSFTMTRNLLDALVNDPEGTILVMKLKITKLCTKYETFKIKNGESLQDMITRFTAIVNQLASLRKVYITEELVDKVLRYLPKSWEIKVTAIREAKDLTNMTLD